MLHKDCGGEATARVCGLSPVEIAWLNDSVDYERGIMRVYPPVLDAQPARWLSAMRWIGHCKADEMRPKGGR